MHISGKPYFQLGSGFWASTLEQDHHELLHYFSARAQEILARHQACLPDDDRLELIVRAAVEARFLYFVAAMNEPTTADLDGYFDQFVMQSIAGIPDFNEAGDDN
jgi:hypothetical protein